MEKNVENTKEMDLVVIKNPLTKRIISKVIRKPISKAFELSKDDFALTVGDVKIEHDGTEMNFNVELKGHINSEKLYSILINKGVI